MSVTQGFCRDCLNDCADDVRRCAHCGSPRIIRHDELYTLTIAHLDCDAFFAAVEKRDNPDLVDKPLIIGGGTRGVVSTACYLARIHGVKSAMPMFKARKLCPQAVVIPPSHGKYSTVGREVRALMRDVTPLVEPVSIDEAFLDLSGTERLHRQPAAKTLAALATRIEREIGISVSIGLSHNKFLAKIASDLDKPRGFAVIGRAETLDFLKTKPVSMIYGVGQSFQAKLARDGITRIGQLQQLNEEDLTRRYGQMGGHIARLSRGLDSRTVKTDRPTKSLSSETTFEHDIEDGETLRTILWPLCEKLSARLKTAGLSCTTVQLKLKTSSFQTISRATSLHYADNHAETLYQAGIKMLEPLIDGTAYRLIGIGGTQLQTTEVAQSGLFDKTGENKTLRAEDALDLVRSKFGDSAISKGRGLRKK